MGGKAKKSIFHEVIKSAEQYEEVVERTENNGPLAIIDTHLSWCGPCETMVPNY